MKPAINSNGARNFPRASWTAVAERSGDTAFGRTKISRIQDDPRACESGVALRFPPQSMTRWVAESSPGNFEPLLKCFAKS